MGATDYLCTHASPEAMQKYKKTYETNQVYRRK